MPVVSLFSVPKPENDREECSEKEGPSEKIRLAVI